ncbi:MAG TPA: HlyD family efflux transporter periplasmic adaptor subunit [bacterium]|nr:HlyD family efflux transporter periplasmic adaptor subunit [bacterium]
MEKRVLVGFGIILSAFLVSFLLIATRPHVERRKVENTVNAIQVDVIQMKTGSNNVVIEAMGKVEPSESIEIIPQVSGKIIWKNRNFIPGGIIKKGEDILKIENTDYELAIPQKEADLATATLNMKLEEGKQAVARKEYEMLGKDLSDEEKEMVLRKYYLENAEKAVSSAKAALEKAKLDNARTVIKAPFNAIVIETAADIGSIVSSGSVAAKIANCDSYWVNLSLPMEKTGLIGLPEPGKKGSKVMLSAESVWGKTRREGEIVKIGASLQDSGYMARLIVKIDDPLSLKKENLELPKLVIGMFLNSEITGEVVENTVEIPRSVLREGDKILIAGTDGKMKILKPEIISKGKDKIILKGEGLNGVLLITSMVSSPAENIPVKIFSKDGVRQEKPVEKNSSVNEERSRK